MDADNELKRIESKDLTALGTNTAIGNGKSASTQIDESLITDHFTETINISVGLVDADLLNGGTRHPNLVLMKIAGYLHDNNIPFRLIISNDEPIDTYNHIYVSRVFSSTPIPVFIEDALANGMQDRIHFGGTGSYVNEKTVKKFKLERDKDLNQLKNDAFLKSISNDNTKGIDMKQQMPYYKLYDEYVRKKESEGRKPSYFNDYKFYSIGFLTRGCVRHCPFCVNKLEKKVYRYSKLEWFLDKERDSKGKLVRPYIYLWDDNFLAAPRDIWEPALKELIDSKRPFQFRQGLDERMLADSPDGELMAEMLSKCKYHGDFIFAFDNWRDREKIEKALKIWKKYKPKRSTKFYLFCGYQMTDNDEKLYQDIKEVFQRIEVLMTYGCFGYIMRHADYTNHPLSNIYVQLARWCNQPQFYRYMSFWEYCYRNQSFWEQKTKKLEVPNQIPYEEFEQRLLKDYYQANGIKLCKPLTTLVEFISKYPDKKAEILEMFSIKLKSKIDSTKWTQE